MLALALTVSTVLSFAAEASAQICRYEYVYWCNPYGYCQWMYRWFCG